MTGEKGATRALPRSARAGRPATTSCVREASGAWKERAGAAGAWGPTCGKWAGAQVCGLGHPRGQAPLGEACGSPEALALPPARCSGSPVPAPHLALWLREGPQPHARGSDAPGARGPASRRFAPEVEPSRGWGREDPQQIFFGVFLPRLPPPPQGPHGRSPCPGDPPAAPQPVLPQLSFLSCLRSGH